MRGTVIVGTHNFSGEALSDGRKRKRVAPSADSGVRAKALSWGVLIKGVMNLGSKRGNEARSKVLLRLWRAGRVTRDRMMPPVSIGS